MKKKKKKKQEERERERDIDLCSSFCNVAVVETNSANYTEMKSE